MNILNILKEVNVQKAAHLIDTQQMGVIVHDPSGNGVEIRTPVKNTSGNASELENYLKIGK